MFHLTGSLCTYQIQVEFSSVPKPFTSFTVTELSTTCISGSAPPQFLEVLTAAVLLLTGEAWKSARCVLRQEHSMG